MILEGLKDVGGQVRHEIWVFGQHVRARTDVEVYRSMREFLLSEASGAGEKPRIGDRLGMLVLRKRDRDSLNQQISESLARYQDRTLQRRVSGETGISAETWRAFAEVEEALKGNN